jgi:hypothetical protein
MWARAILSGSILIGAIVVAPLYGIRAESFSIVPLEKYAVAPLNEVCLPKNVFIIGPSPNQHQRRWTNSNAISNKRIRRWHFDNLTCFNSFWGNKKWFGRNAKRKLIWQGSSRREPIDANSHVPRRRIASVFPSWLNGKSGYPKPFIDRPKSFRQFLFFCLNVCQSRDFKIESVEKNKSSFGRFQRIFASLPQFVCGEPQQYSRDSQNNGECRRDGFAVLVNKFSETIEVVPVV